MESSVDVLALGDLHVDARQRVGFDLVGEKHFRDTVKLDDRLPVFRHAPSPFAMWRGPFKAASFADPRR
jgi:hypothetical protein